MQILDVSFFAPCLNQTFLAAIGSSQVELTLVNLQKLRPHPYPGMRRDPFVLTFRSPMKTIFPQQIYAMENATVGKLAIFIAPRAMDRDGILYDAVFN